MKKLSTIQKEALHFINDNPGYRYCNEQFAYVCIHKKTIDSLLSKKYIIEECDLSVHCDQINNFYKFGYSSYTISEEGKNILRK